MANLDKEYMVKYQSMFLDYDIYTIKKLNLCNNQIGDGFNFLLVLAIQNPPRHWKVGLTFLR